MNPVVIGNVVSFIGALFMIAIGFIKRKRHILVAQCFQFGIMGAGQWILGGTTGVISNLVSIVRNLVCIWLPFSLPLKLVFMVIQVLMTVAVRPVGLVAWFPTIAACLFTWFLDTKKETLLKIVIIACQLLWIVYDASIQNYSALIFDVFTVLSNLAGIFIILKTRKK